MSDTALHMKTKIALSVAIVLWASAFVGIRASLVSYTPGSMALFRFAVASICMIFIYGFMKNKSPFAWKPLLKLMSVGVISIATYHLCLNQGELTVPSGEASFIVSLSPIITVILAVLFLNESLNIFIILGMMISFLGMLIILFSQTDTLAFHAGILYVFISAIAGSIYSVWQKPYLKKYHAIEVTAFLIWGATVPLFYFLPDLVKELPHASTIATASVIYLGIFPAAIAYLAWSYALNVMPASRATNYLYFMPVLSTLMAWILLKEVPAPLALLGCVVALLGVCLVNESHHLIEKFKRIQ